jgi:Domain of unknown function (DUF1848)
MADSPNVYKGTEKGYPYSLSRWTDVVGTPNKWQWFREQLSAGYMMGFNPATGVPVRWSLYPEDTLGFIFWTRSPEALIRNAGLLREYKVKVHMTVTGWHEVELGAPSLEEGSQGLRGLVEIFGPSNVTWRFSPVPMVPDVRERFRKILDSAHKAKLRSVYLSFLQPNDRMPEIRTPEERYALLRDLADMAGEKDIEVRLCNEDRLLVGAPKSPNLCSGVCAPPEDFQGVNLGVPPSEGCGCVLMVDPFSINEACGFGCKYCYTANQSSANHKRNTTKPALTVVQ